jgi:hypothetical protein
MHVNVPSIEQIKLDGQTERQGMDSRLRGNDGIEAGMASCPSSSRRLPSAWSWAGPHPNPPPEGEGANRKPGPRLGRRACIRHSPRHPRVRGDSSFCASSSRTRGSIIPRVILAHVGIHHSARHPRARGDPSFPASSSRTRGSIIPRVILAYVGIHHSPRHPRDGGDPSARDGLCFHPCDDH